MTRRISTVVVLAAAVLAAVGVALAVGGGPAQTAEDRVAELQHSLRCPTCAAESIADSQAPIAASMRAEVAEQVGEGRSDEEILGWFEERYGATVLLSPPMSGVSALVWLLPVLVLLVAVVGTVWQRRRSDPTETADGEPAVADPATVPGPEVPGTGWPPPRAPRRALPATAVVGGSAALAVVAAGVLVWTGGTGSAAPPSPADAAATAEAAEQDGDVLAALRAATAESPEDVEPWLALGRVWERRGRLQKAADAYRQAVEAEPRHPTARFLLAFSLLRTGERPRATELLEGLVADHPDHAEALLLLGTAQRQEGNPAGVPTLRRFLAVAPDHPAAGRVRALLRKEANR